MDKINLAWRYLKWYQDAITPFLDDYFQAKLSQAKRFGQVPYVALEHFYQLIQRGKKVRGAFMVLGYQLGGGLNEGLIIKTSLFIELLHTALLIHDDIMDQDQTRRGLAAGHVYLTQYAKERRHPNPSLFGLSNAITIADTAFYLSWQRLMESEFNDSLKVKTGRLYADYIIRLAYGQMLDVANLYQWHSDREEILKIFKYKTAEYTGSLPLILGYTLAGGVDDGIKQALRDYGLAFGWIFQIKDDILGIFGDPQKTGKGVGSDLVQAKNTILVWYVENRAKPRFRTKLAKLMGLKKLSLTQLDQAREIFTQSGAYDYAKQLADEYLDKGLKTIDKITQHKDQADLLKAFLYLAFKRDK